MYAFKKPLLLLALLEGAVVMAVQLTSAHMLAPYFGAGIQTWGVVIGTTVLSLAIGYYLGGRISEKFQTDTVVYWTILLASIFIVLMPSTAKNLTTSLADINRISALLIVAPLLLLPTLILLGMVPVLIIQILTDSAAKSGNITGHVYTVSTIGGIIGTYMIGFFIIPQWGLAAPTVFTGLFCGLICMALLLSRGKMIALSYMAIVVFSLLSMKQPKTRSNIKVLHQSEGLMGQLMVVDMRFNQRYDRVLFVNRMGQTYINMLTGKSKWSYVDYITSVASKLPEDADVLLLGLGGGTIANQLSSLLGLNVTAVELDDRIPKVATDYFAMDKKVKVVIDDARRYIENCNEKYDLIIFDAFKGEVIPAQVLSQECFLKARSLLNKNGFIAVNFNGFIHGDIGKAGRSVYKTLISTGMKTIILPTYEDPKYRNCIFIAAAETMDYSQLRFNLQNEKGDVDLTSLFLDPAGLDMEDAIVFVDDKPVLEHYNAEAAAVWRNEYNSSFTKMFVTKGIPLFN